MSEVAAEPQPDAATRQRIDDTDTKLNHLRELIEESALAERGNELPCMHGRSNMYVRQLTEEYLKFLILKATAKDTTATHLSPSGEVDQIWHLHLLDTRNYAACCKYLGIGFIHHNPHGVHDGQEKALRLSNTNRLYQRVFGYPPHSHFWGSPDEYRINDYYQDHYDISDEEFNSLYSTEMDKGDREKAQAASETLAFNIAQEVFEEENPVSDFFKEHTTNQRRPFFLRENLPKCLESTCYMVEECPNHQVTNDDGINVIIKTMTGKEIKLQVLPTFSVLHVKFLILEKDGSPIAAQRLIFESTMLTEEDTLADHNVGENDVLQLLLSLSGC